jgi:PhoPQ-activated pathogenicity-related protein
MTDDTLREAVDSERFYDLCQLYRMAPISNQAVVVKRFEAIQNWVLAFARAQQARGLKEAAETLRQYAAVCQEGTLSERKATLTIMSEQLDAQATAMIGGYGHE